MWTRAMRVACATALSAALAAPAAAQTLTPWEIALGDPLVMTLDDLEPDAQGLAELLPPPIAPEAWQPLTRLVAVDAAPPTLGHLGMRFGWGGAPSWYRTVVTLPLMGPAELHLVLEGARGPAWLTIHNADYPDGLVVAGALLGPAHARLSDNLAPFLVAGDVNELVVTHLDVCCWGAKPVQISVWADGMPLLTVDDLLPVVVARDVMVEAGPMCRAPAAIDAGSFDPEGWPLTLTQAPAWRAGYPLGETEVTLTACDVEGACESARATVTVVDTVPPSIVCPALPTLGTDEVPFELTPRAIDACGATARVIGHRCVRLGLGPDGQPGVIPTERCDVRIDRGIAVVLDAGAPGDVILYRVRAVDPSLNVAEAVCGLLVTAPDGRIDAW